MKRREMLLATASLSIVGSSAVFGGRGAAQESDQIENVSVDLGFATVDIGEARLTYDDEENTVVFQGQDWMATGENRTLSLARATVTIERVDAETYERLRSGAVQTFDQGSLSPLLSSLIAADVDPDSPISIEVGPVTTDRGALINEATATGTVGGVVPDGVFSLSSDESVSDLGPARFHTVTAQRGGLKLTAEDVVAEPVDGVIEITAAEGTVKAPPRSFDFENGAITLRRPADGATEQLSALRGLRRLAANRSLTVSAIRTTFVESNVTVSNTIDAVRNTRFELTFESLTRGGQSVAQNVGTSGTLSELLQVLRGRDVDDGTQTNLPKEAVVSAPGTEDYHDYTFEVTGELEKLEPNEDARHAVDDVIDTGDRVRVEGTVGTGDDRFAFSGELIEVDVPEEVQIEVRNR